MTSIDADLKNRLIGDIDVTVTSALSVCLTVRTTDGNSRRPVRKIQHYIRVNFNYSYCYVSRLELKHVTKNSVTKLKKKRENTAAFFAKG